MLSQTINLSRITSWKCLSTFAEFTCHQATCKESTCYPPCHQFPEKGHVAAWKLFGVEVYPLLPLSVSSPAHYFSANISYGGVYIIKNEDT